MSMSECIVKVANIRNLISPVRFAVLTVVIVAALGKVTPTGQVFTNSFLVEFNQDVERAEADQIARENGFQNAGSVSFFSVINNSKKPKLFS